MVNSSQKFNNPADIARLDIDPFDLDVLTDPYRYHDALREAGPLFWLSKYGIWGTARHGEASAVLKDWQRFCSSAGVGLANFRAEEPFRPPSLVLEADPPEHTRARGVLARAMSQKSVKAMSETFERDADEIIRAVLARGEIEAIAEIAIAYPLRVFPDAVGLDAGGRENLLIYGNMVFNSFGPHNQIFQDSTAQLAPVTEWIGAHCARDKLAPGGLGDVIYREADAGGVSEEEAALLVRSLLTAGVDTTVAAIGNALYCFAQHPEQWQLLRADPAHARHAFEEVLRYEAPIQTFFRTATQATELSGVQIGADEKILIFLNAANRDPRRWDNADSFDITRRPAGHLAFGTGVHRCVGQRVAQLEGEIILRKLAERVARIELTGAPVWRPNNTLHTLARLPLRLIPA